MMKFRSAIRASRIFVRARDAVASVEFALLIPIFAVLCVGTLDFGMAFYSKLRLSTAVGEGAQYAFLTGATVTAPQVQTVVQNAATLSPITVNATYNSAACYCLTGSPMVLSSQTCGTNCANGTPAGKYVQINASYTYQPIFPGYNLIANGTLNESATVRVQ